MDSARGVAAIVVVSRNSSYNAIVRNGQETIAIVRGKGRSKHVSSVMAVASIAVAPLADFPPTPNTRLRE